MKSSDKISDFTNKAAYDYFVRKTKGYIKYDNLSAAERISFVKKIKLYIVIYSGLLGALGVVFLYLPQYWFPDFFSPGKYVIPLIDYEYEISIKETIFGVILVIIEIWLLTMSDIRAVGKIAAIYGFPPEEAYKKYNEELAELVNIGLGKDISDMNNIGINPFQNNSKFSMLALFIIFRMKAILSKFVFKFLLKKVLGKFAFRAVLDLSAVPVYAFWNAYASSIIIRKAHMRMYAHSLMYSTGKWFYERYGQNDIFKSLLYDTLAYIAITKKTFYPSDYLFYKHILELFKIPIEKEHKISGDYIQNVLKENENIENAISKLLIIGFLIDGNFGSFEKKVIKKLISQGIIPYQKQQINDWTDLYKKGQGFDDLLSK